MILSIYWFHITFNLAKTCSVLVFASSKFPNFTRYKVFSNVIYEICCSICMNILSIGFTCLWINIMYEKFTLWMIYLSSTFLHFYSYMALSIFSELGMIYHLIYQWLCMGLKLLVSTYTVYLTLHFIYLLYYE